MWTGYVVGLNVRLKSLVQLSNTDIENILEKVRLTCVLVSLLHFFVSFSEFVSVNSFYACYSFQYSS